jgi:DNA-binding MarR family transcriptional regulator
MQEYLGLLIAVARRRLKWAVLSRVGRRRLSVQQFWMLIVLAEHPGFSQARIAERLHADAPTVSRTLSGLLERRLVRVDLDPSDRRRTRISLTAAGRRLATELAPLAAEIRAAVIEGMGPEEIAAVRRGLLRVIGNLEGFEAHATSRRRLAP